MQFCILAISSVTYALKAQACLREAGIHGEIVRPDASATRRGCAYGISVECEHRSAVTRLLRRAGIPHSEWILPK